MKTCNLTVIFTLIIGLMVGCVANSTRYIEVKQKTNLYMRGSVVATVPPGSTLRVLGVSKKGGLEVVDEKTGDKGYVSEQKMNKINRIYVKDSATGEEIKKVYHTEVQKVGDMITMQLAYDDGSKEGSNSPWSENAGSEIGVIFSSPAYPATLEKASFYVSNSGTPTTPFKINIYQLNQDKNPGTNLAVVSINGSAESGNQWVDVDLAPYSITVNGDFMVSMEWLAPHHPKKGKSAQVIGTDMSKPEGRSYWKFVNRGNQWKPVSEIGKSGDRNNMIRATVTYKDMSK